jgi:hypothetical protein
MKDKVMSCICEPHANRADKKNLPVEPAAASYFTVIPRKGLIFGGLGAKSDRGQGDGYPVQP